MNIMFTVSYCFSLILFCKAFFFETFLPSLYLLTTSFAKEKHLTFKYNLIKFSRHNDLHSFQISISQCSTMLSHMSMADAEDKTSFTIISTGRCVIISLLVSSWNVNSHAGLQESSKSANCQKRREHQWLTVTNHIRSFS